MLQKFAMVKYGVFVAKICKHALCASTVRDIWWSPLARQLLPPCCDVMLHTLELLPIFDFYVCSRVKFHKSSFWVPILAAGGPY